MLTARQRFKIGDKVVCTDATVETYGKVVIVVGFVRDNVYSIKIGPKLNDPTKYIIVKAQSFELAPKKMKVKRKVYPTVNTVDIPEAKRVESTPVSDQVAVSKPVWHETHYTAAYTARKKSVFRRLKDYITSRF